MTRGYLSRRIAETMRAPRPAETPDTDAASLYAQTWRRHDGMMTRQFTVLALDDTMAEVLGRLRLAGRYDAHPSRWTLETNRRSERLTSTLMQVLHVEHPDETAYRAQVFLAGRNK